MKKTITYFLAIFSLFVCLNSSAQLATSVPGIVCLGGTTGTCNALVTATVPGATSYTWSVTYPSGSASISQLSGVNGTNVAVSFTNCGTYTVSCYPFNGSSPVGSPLTKFMTVSCVAAPTVVITSPAVNICVGGALPLSATGAVTYTWIPGQFPASTFTIYPAPAAPCYTVFGANSAGCTHSAVTCSTVSPTPTITLPTTTTICQGSNLQLLAGGAASYTWSIGSTGAAISLTPAATACYSVIGTAVNGCTNMVSTCVLVTPTPNVLMSTSATNICSGNSIGLSATGATSYTWLPGSIVGASFNDTPMSSTCYTVIGGNGSGCYGTASTCVTVVTTPTITLPATTTVCLGSSALLTASGANSYIWNVGPTTASISVIPTVSTCYSVIGTTNGCTTTAICCLSVNNSCSDVWPGDANSDGVVDNTDVLELGLAFSNTGPARPSASNIYASQFSTNWTGTISTGKNKCHADCNGDGIVNANDTLAIYNNYSLTHLFKPADALSGDDINIVTNSTVVNGGSWNKADIVLGSSSNVLSQLYGVAYEINFDQTSLQTDSAYLIYTSSFFNASSQNINFRKNFFVNGKITTASVRSNGSNVSGNGKIGELWFKVKNGLPANTQINLAVFNAKKINNVGQLSAISSGSTTVSVSNAIPSSIAQNTLLEKSVRVFPNPATSCLVIESTMISEISYSLFDISGRKVSEGRFESSKTLDLSSYSSGSYLIQFNTSTEKFNKKLVILK